MSEAEPGDHRAARWLNSIMFGALLTLAIAFALWTFVTGLGPALAVYRSLPLQAHQALSNELRSFVWLLVLARVAWDWARRRRQAPSR